MEESDLQRLRSTLASLQQSLTESPDVNPQSRALVERAMADVSSLIASRSTEATQDAAAETPEPTLIERLTQAEQHFEETHPTLAGLVGSVLDALGRMGI